MKNNRRPVEDNEHVKQLLALFPRGDPDYFRYCLEHYKENPVERVAEKVIVELGGHYPQIPLPQQLHDNRLNACLRILALDLFPDCDIGVLRDLVLQSRYAHVENVVDKLLALGKWPERLEYGKMDASEGIRSEKYKRQAQMQLIQDYPQVWKSSIRAVLAENNWDYIKSYDQLKEMGSGGFWTTLRNFFMHWSATSLHHEHTIVTDYHLLEQMKELEGRTITVQIESDRTFAHKVNLIEYTNHHQLMTCDCCYGDCTFEQLLFCSNGSHGFCHDCIIHYISEGLFGQGALRGQPRIRCIASTEDCIGCLPTRALQKVVSSDIWKAYENSLLEDCCRGRQRIQCCACSYFELDESIRPLQAMYAGRLVNAVARWIMVLEMIFFLFMSHSRRDNNVFIPLIIMIALLSMQWISLSQWDIKSDLEIAYQRVAKSRRGPVFSCRNCKTVTCLECQRPVRGLHTCWEKETDGLRLYVEKAMADAVKRTCPNCSLSFQKSDGCNKIVCRCGYAMCYVCRKDIGKESYAHFCEHFRERPGTRCTSCKKCDLYKTDPEDELVQRAAVKARDQYLQAHPEVVRSNIVIGPKTTFDRLDEWRQESVLWCLEKGLDYFV